MTRLATNLDISELIRLAWSGFKETWMYGSFIEFDPHGFAEVILNVMSNKDRGIVLAANHPTKQGRLVGCAIAMKTPILFSPLVISATCALSVDRASRNKGVGRILVDGIEKWAQENGCKMIFGLTTFETKKQEKFWQSLGFEPTDIMNMKRLKENKVSLTMGNEHA